MVDAMETSRDAAPLVGGWTPFGPLDARSRAVFGAATAGLVGVEYMPREVSTQVVSGMNYRFRCDARVVSPGAPTFTVTMEIYQPLDGPPVITRIVRTSWPAMEKAVVPGGWTPFRPVDAESRAVFETAMHGWVGVGYTPREVSTQVVAGMNYRFICDAQVVYPGAPKYEALVTIYQSPGGEPHVVDIHTI